jgi:hypothetical protein
MDIIIPKFRERSGRGRIMHNVRIDRYWRHKETGDWIEVQRFLRIDMGHEYRVIYKVSPDNPKELREREFSISLAALREQYEPVGNMSTKF